MKKNRKIMGGFVACLHCLLMCIPLLVLVYNVGRRAIEKNFSYETTYVYDNNGNYQESSKTYELADIVSYAFQDCARDLSYCDYEVDLDNVGWESYSNFYLGYYYNNMLLMNNDYLGLFDTGDDISMSTFYVYAYLNYYLNWIINMSVIVFIPEILIVFIDICRKLIYSFSHKIEGGF